MKIIGAALGDEGNLSAGRTALISICADRRYTKLLDGIQCGTYRTLKSVAGGLTIVVDTVQRNIGLIAAAAVKRAVARVNVGVASDILISADIDHARLEAQYLCSIAAFKGQCQNLAGIEGVTERCVGSIHGF